MEQKIDSCPKALFSVMDALKKKFTGRTGGKEEKKRKIRLSDMTPLGDYRI